MTLPNGTQTTYTYDPASQVTNILHQLTATNSQINKAEYVYNNVGNRTSLTDRCGAQSFGYDALDRLTSASHPLLLDPQAFAYDAVGNRTTNGSVVNTGNQLTADANFTYQYDDNGNLTRKTLLATGNYSQYTYDAENRLTQVQEFAAGNPTAITTSSYRYDGLGRRIEKAANGQTRRYIYDGEDILLEYDGSNVLQARYTHGPGIDEPIAVTKGATTLFYHQDGLGSVTDLTDSVGATAKSYSYDAYGNILDSPGAVDQPYTYTGREFDAETGLYYYRARYYDPNTGRFISRDPFSLPGSPNSINAYAFVRNNPARFLDPFGLFPNCTEIGTAKLVSQRVEPEKLHILSHPFLEFVPIGPSAGPDLHTNPKNPPIGPQYLFELWQIQVSYWHDRQYMITNITKRTKFLCIETENLPCGQTRESRNIVDIDEQMDPIKELISDEILSSRERIRMLGTTSWPP